MFKIRQDMMAWFRIETINDHLKQSYHHECLKASKMCKITRTEITELTNMRQMIIKSK